MPIITISKGSYGYGLEVAEKLAETLGYECVSRQVLLDASETFNIPEIQLVKAIEDPPSFIERWSHGKEKYIAYIRSAFLKSIKRDNVVYHGFAGHFFVRDIPSVCKVRINAAMRHRIKKVVDGEGVTAENAEKMIHEIDEVRRRWSQHLYGIDTADADLYDMVFKVDNLKADEVVQMIAEAVHMPGFQVSAEARAILENRSLECEIKANLVDRFPITRHVSADAGAVTVVLEAAVREKEKLSTQLEAALEGIQGIRSLDIRFKH